MSSSTYMTKRESKPHRSWCFTWNNYNDDNVKHLISCFSKICNKYIFQEEMGEEKTPHLQGVINLKQGYSFSKLKKLLDDKIHLEVCRNFKNSWKYCCKEETRCGEIYSFPKILNNGELINKIEINEWLLKCALESDV